jgi:hypothetical protein
MWVAGTPRPGGPLYCNPHTKLPTLARVGPGPAENTAGARFSRAGTPLRAGWGVRSEPALCGPDTPPAGAWPHSLLGFGRRVE